MRHAPLDTAAVIAVGSELLTPYRVDTNSLFLTARLNELAIEVRRKIIVGDDPEVLGLAVRRALDDVGLIVLTGGLGPTDDDITREALASVLETPLVEDVGLVAEIRRRFESRGMRMPEISRRQAQVPRGAEVLRNDQGTAPGLWIERDEKVIVALPGPPRELEPMANGELRERLAARASGLYLARRVVAVAGRAESHVEERAQPVYRQWRDRGAAIAATILAGPGQIELHLSTRAATRLQAEASLEAAVADLTAALGPDVYSTDGGSLEAVVGALLRRRGWRVAIAESCTGGLVASRLTDVPGSSGYLDLAVVAYGNAAKIDLLGVPAALIDEHGAVSEPVAVAMATGVAARAPAPVGVGITGIAGPSGGTPDKPVGTVCIAVSTEESSRVRTFRFRGERSYVKRQASQTALDMLRRILDDRG